MNGKQMHYDQSNKLFSPNGSIFQVQYARAAVQKAPLTVGIKFKSGIIIIANKYIDSRLIDVDELRKVFFVETHIGCSSSGLRGDTEFILRKMQAIGQYHRVMFGEKIPVYHLVKRISNMMRVYTQFGGVRPFGAAFLVAGYDDNKGLQLYATDPSGAYFEATATSVGARSDLANARFSDMWKANIGLEESFTLGFEAIYDALEGNFKHSFWEVGLIRPRDATFRILGQKEILGLIDCAIGRLESRERKHLRDITSGKI